VAISIPVRTTCIRPLDVRRDLLPVADLIELCFRNTMDKDGREYVRQIRRAANNFSSLRWIAGANERVSFPLHGYVWEDEGQVVGNLSLIPFYRRGKWRYLIANVAVHPNYRRRGIGRKLTEKALEHIRDHGVPSAWLQVRDDNPIAYNLYCSLGFIERVRRATWVSTDPTSAITGPIRNVKVNITQRAPQDWELQETWLREIYPPEVTWNLPIKIDRYKPTFWRGFMHFLNGEQTRHWAAHLDNQLLGLITWEPGHNRVDNLWIATTEAHENQVLPALLTKARNWADDQRILVANYPAERARQTFQRSGFEQQNVLIWMEAKLTD